MKKRWVGSDDWDVFPGTLTCGSHLGGVVNLDYDVEFPTKGWSGMTIRAFDLEARQWSLYWINSKSGKLFPPPPARASRSCGGLWFRSAARVNIVTQGGGADAA